MAQSKIFRGTARRISTNPDTGTRSYFYHNTAIVGVYVDGTIRLNSGGWRSATTKLAMNQASNQDNLGFKVYQRKREWYISYKGAELAFSDGMFLGE
jgi:hypothetical protein